VNLPMTSDRKLIATLEVLSTITVTAAIMGSSLYVLLAAKAVVWSLQKGNSACSASFYAVYSLICSNVLHSIETARSFENLAADLANKLEDQAMQAEVAIASRLLLHRHRHLQHSLPALKTGYLKQVSLGRFEHAGYTAVSLCTTSLWLGLPLSEVGQNIQTYRQALSQIHQLSAMRYTDIYEQVQRNLTVPHELPTVLEGEAFQESIVLSDFLATYDFSGLATLYGYKLILACLFDNAELAQQYLTELSQYTVALNGLFFEAQIYFYGALTELAFAEYSAVSGEKSGQSPQLQQPILSAAQLEAAEAYQSKLASWAINAPMNHQHKVDLLQAEKCRLLGHKADAIALYDRAIAGAKEHQYIHEEALANELAAKFYLGWEKESIAATYLQAAYYGYARWGAKAKTQQLENKYPELLAAILNTDTVESPTDMSWSKTEQVGTCYGHKHYQLDLPSVMRAAQAISQEIELEKLLETLLQIAIVNAGAQRGHLLLVHEKDWQVVASADDQQAQVLETELASYEFLPQRLIYDVARTKETAVFENLSQDSRFSADPYINRYQPKSVLCLPTSCKGQLVGILYLENNLSTGAFTRDRIEVLQLLASQAAISIENARLYRATENYSQTLEVEVANKTENLRQQAEALDHKARDLEQTLTQLRQTQAQLIHSEKMSSLGKMVAGVAHEINNPVNFIQANLEYTGDYIEDLMDLLALYHRDYPQPTAAIQEKREEIDLEFLSKDIHLMLESMTVGSKRIRDIVLNLKSFSRLDESGVKAVDLHEGIESTLALLETRLKGEGQASEINIVKHYGQLPLVTCEANQLNQVFLSILGNAIDAIQGRDQDCSSPTPSPVADPPTITIRTETTAQEEVEIIFENNGELIPPEIQAKIFDPFFTTKPVGSGVGLGLSVSYSIIKRHGGLLTVQCPEPQTAEGSQAASDRVTAFKIRLPQVRSPNSEFVQLSTEQEASRNQL
ncbi:MAG: GAF domain-containing protein, partial [Cyanobacteria bacterium J06649_4]